jgi:hypothetical protein
MREIRTTASTTRKKKEVRMKGKGVSVVDFAAKLDKNLHEEREAMIFAQLSPHPRFAVSLDSVS